MLISDWRSDVCSSDLFLQERRKPRALAIGLCLHPLPRPGPPRHATEIHPRRQRPERKPMHTVQAAAAERIGDRAPGAQQHASLQGQGEALDQRARSEEHTSELQSLMRLSYAVLCLKYKNNTIHSPNSHYSHS